MDLFGKPGKFRDMRLYIKELREDRGVTQDQLAERIGVDAGYLSKMENGKRQINSKWLQKIAYELRCEPADLLRYTKKRSPREVRSVMVRGRVQAGVFGESYELPEDEQYEIEVPKITDDKRAFALEVVGPSMNEVLDDGSFAVCVPILDRTDLEDGDFVICERVRHDGQVEATVKEFVIHKDGTAWLQPRSDDPAYQTALPLDPLKWTDADRREIAEIRITAVVEGGFTRLSRRFRTRR